MSKLSIAHLAQNKDLPNFDLYYRNPKNKVEADRVNIISFLITRGYFLYRTSVSKHIFIRIMDNIVCEVGKKDLVDEVLNFIHDHEERGVYEAFLTNISRFFSDEFLRTLPAKDVQFRKDRKDAMQFYYQNCIVKITGKKVTTHSYAELDGYIWESQILPRSYNSDIEIKDSDFKRFCYNISSQDDKRYQSVCSAIGFLIHNYKSPGYCPAIILNDEVISDHPEGGTGKGILLKAVEQFINTVVIEGKTFNFDKNFVYQAVNSDTKLLSFQDVNRSFDFERLFSVLTDGINVEKKGLQSIHYSFLDSPKIAITTNYAIKGAGNSHERRRFELEISQFYNKNHTPLDDFSKMMFIEWDENEFFYFDSFIIECCQFYLNNGLVVQELINLPEKRLMAEISPEFAEFIDENLLQPGESITRTAFYNKFKEQYKTSRIASRTFYSMLMKYCEFHKIVCHEQKTNGIWNFIF